MKQREVIHSVDEAAKGGAALDEHLNSVEFVGKPKTETLRAQDTAELELNLKHGPLKGKGK